jgi:streptogrisin C
MSWCVSTGWHCGTVQAKNQTVNYAQGLQKWHGGSWVDVAAGRTANPDETITYSGTAGCYRYEVYAYSRSGSYSSRPVPGCEPAWTG